MIFKEQKVAFRKAFDAFDQEKQGFIHTNMVGTILSTMGQAFEEKDLKEIAEVDTDGSGELEFEEFLVLVARFLVEEDKAKMQEELKEAFRLYDKQGNGYINVSDLREILRALDDKITEEELDEFGPLGGRVLADMIAEIDTDGSGTVDFDEFMEMMAA
uniref:Troponin C n=1 Tax=Peripatoides novaezealandiae TaxID=49105 RepID=A0A0A7AAM2_9BILA|nr:troponin C [Peripatoides novaezealandiae]